MPCPPDQSTPRQRRPGRRDVLQVLSVVGCAERSPAELTGGLGGRSIEGMAAVGWTARHRGVILAAASGSSVTWYSRWTASF